MKHSIKKIFQNLNTYLSFIMMISLFTLILIAEQNLSFEKVDILNKQKSIIDSLTKLKKYDAEIALIQFNAKSNQLRHEIDKLKSLYTYDYTDRYIFNNETHYLENLDILTDLIETFNQKAHNLYTNTKEDKDAFYADELEKNFHTLNDHINSILLTSIKYNQEKFKMVEKVAFLIFLINIIASLWYKKRLYYIYKDLEFLFHINKNKLDYKIYSVEADAISMRMNRKSTSGDNLSMLDPVTGINNHKGMINSYSEKKNLKDSNFTSVSVIEIDNFSKSKRAFSQELTQNILKKIAYTISLHEQAVDVIARTDYNQFTLIFSRVSKAQAFKDTDLIRQSIEELKFNTPDKGAITITVSGGFIIKPNNTNLEEAIRQAKEILAYAKEIGTNKIFQTKDYAERDI